MKHSFVAVLSAFTFCLSSSAASATQMLDQHHALVQSVGGIITFEDYLLGQTLTVGKTGTLSQVDLVLGKVGSPTEDVLFEIRNVSNGIPVAGSPLYSKSIPISQIPPRGGPSNFPFVPVDVSSANLSVTAGDQLALIVTRDAPYGFDHTVVWDRGFPGYELGDPMTRFGTQPWSALTGAYDFGFQTWVTPPVNESLLPGPNYLLFESSRGLPHFGPPYLGHMASSTHFLGVNFEIVRPTTIKSVGAQLLGDSPGQVFAAIVQIDDRNGAPDPTDLSGSDVLGHTLLDLPTGFFPTDVSSDLEITLQPGFYGLWFGSGKFGATGEAFLSSGNDPVGARSIWTLQQPSGIRGFLSSNIRLFVEAASTPGTVQLRPTTDVAAVDYGSGVYTLYDGETHIRLDQTPFDAADKRGILEFDISAVPANAIIESVRLEVHTIGRSTNGVDPAQMAFYGYAGNGVAEPHDALKTNTLVGTSPAVDQLGLIAVDIDPGFVQSLLGSDYLGLVATSPHLFSSVTFFPTENRGFGEAPLLTITLSVPGDFDGNLTVDGHDFLVWQRGDSPNPLSTLDLAEWQTNFGSSNLSAHTSHTVPEPNGLIMLSALATILCGGGMRSLAS